MSAQKQPGYLDNPWRLCLREVQVLVRLPESPSKDIARQLRLSIHTINDHKCDAFKKMDVHRAEHACVEFDRWWQVWQKENGHKLVKVWDELQF